jgi:hypothetical protein
VPRSWLVAPLEQVACWPRSPVNLFLGGIAEIGIRNSGSSVKLFVAQLFPARAQFGLTRNERQGAFTREDAAGTKSGRVGCLT